MEGKKKEAGKARAIENLAGLLSVCEGRGRRGRGKVKVSESESESGLVAVCSGSQALKDLKERSQLFFYFFFFTTNPTTTPAEKYQALKI